MSKYLLVANWAPGGIIEAETKPAGYDGTPSWLCLDIGNLTPDEAMIQWKDLFYAQYPERINNYMADMRVQGYLFAGVAKEDLAVTLWESIYEKQTQKAFDLQTKREKVKALYPLSQSLGEIKSDVVTQINRKIGEIREKYITLVPGQELVYAQKNLEVIRYSSDLTPAGSNYPYIQSEADATGKTLNQAYNVIRTINQTWTTVSAQLEGIRRHAVVDVVNAINGAEIQAAVDTFKTSILPF